MPAFVGRWKSTGPSCFVGMKEFGEAIGFPDLFIEGQVIPFVMTITVEDNTLILDIKYEGKVDSVKEVNEVGKNGTDIFSGIGSLKVDSEIQGDVYMAKATYKGKPISKSYYVKDDTLHCDITYGDLCATTLCTRA